MKQYIELLKDVKHHIGWWLTTGGVIGIFHLFGVHALHTPWWHIGVLHITIVIIDLIKHQRCFS